MMARLFRAPILSAWLSTAALCLAGTLAVLPSAQAAVTSTSQGATLEGQHFDDTMSLSDRTLRLNGLGLRGVAWIKAFVAGLYLPAPTKDVAQALSMPGPKRIRLKIMLDAPSHELTKSLTGRIADHEPAEVQQQLAERLPKLAKLIDGLGDLHDGDTLDLDFVPDKGTHLRFNDKAVGLPVGGEDLYRAILKIFVGDHPVDRRMKQGLMSGGT